MTFPAGCGTLGCVVGFQEISMFRKHRRHAGALLLALGSCGFAVADEAAPACAQTRSPWWSNYNNTDCYCGAQLAQLTVTLPAGLRVAAVCGLRWDSTGPIDLARERLSLDTYSVDGNYPKGFVYLSGTMDSALAGTVSVDPGPAGDLWFFALPDDERAPVFWKLHLTGLDLGTDEHYRKLQAPQPETVSGCMEARATLRLRDPIVLLGETDEAGTDADFDVISVSEYAPCAREP
jgi:hypothetical protein